MVQLHRHNHPNKVPVVSMKIWQGSIDKYRELKMSSGRSSRYGGVNAILPPADMQGGFSKNCLVQLHQ